MKRLTLITLLLSAAQAFANTSHAPKNFETNGKNVVFIDFQNSKSEITFDTKKKDAFAKTTIVFIQNEEGYPIFDLIPSTSNVIIDGEKSSAQTITSPDNVTSYKIVEKKLSPGTHTLYIENQIEENVMFGFFSRSVNAAFWMSDLDDRKYLEQYLPTNLEYDQYKIDFHLEITGASKNHTIYANGEVTKISENVFDISFPEYFQTSSVFFHVVNEGKYPEEKYTYTSIDGRVIPITLYTRSRSQLSDYKRDSLLVLKELEKTYGAWPHPSLVIYGAGMGGMEYCGATMSSLSALGHEITHSYFARGVMPQNGNAGWIDEAIASWRDDGYPRNTRPNFSSTSMASHSIYQRLTDRKAYEQGANFMSYLDSKLSSQGGLKTMLSKLFTSYVHKNITTENLIEFLNAESGLNFDNDFKQYVYGRENASLLGLDHFEENPMHPRLTKQQLLDLL